MADPDRDAPPQASPSQSDLVIDGVKQMIISGRLGPGSRLPIEKDLAARLGVSRGSLREGVRSLAALGVLETRQGDGTYVTSLDPSELFTPLGFFADLQTSADAADLLGTRRILETESAGRAALRIGEQGLAELSDILAGVDGLLAVPDVDLEAFIEADSSFHRTIAAASGSRTLAALIDSLVGRTFRARLWRAISERDSLQEAQDEHRAILAELALHDPDRARIRMAAHLLGVEEYASDHPAAAISTSDPDSETELQ